MKQSWSIALGVFVATLCTALVTGQAQSSQVMLEAARKAETIDGNLNTAIKHYEQIVTRFPSDRAVVADALARMAGAYRKLGDAQAKAIYERVVREYGDQPNAASAARAALASIGGSTQASSSIAMRRVWSGPEVDISGAVSRDGRLLSFTDVTTGDLALRDIQTGTTRRLTDKGPFEKSQSYAERSVFSPDGRYVAYGWAVDEQQSAKVLYELRVVDLQNPTAAPRRITSTPLPWIAPYDWSPDGRWIAVIATTEARRPYTSGLFVVDAQAGTMTLMRRDGAIDGIRFTPDSRAVVSDRRSSSAPLTSDIVAIALGDRREHVLVAGGGRNVPLGWSPDGGLLFASTRAGSRGLW